MKICVKFNVAAITILLLLSGNQSHGQFQIQKEKYWIYKERLKNYVITTSLVSDKGFDIPARRREESDMLYWGDEARMIGYYIATLAMEYDLLTMSVTENNTPKTPIVQSTEPEVAPQFYFYPNPTNGLVNIIPDHLADGTQYSVTLSDLFGKNLSNYKSDAILNLDLSDFSKGVYFLNIKTREYESNKKVVLY